MAEEKTRVVDDSYGNNGEPTVIFEHKGGEKTVATMSAAKAMEAKGYGAIVKGTPKPVKEVTKDADK